MVSNYISIDRVIEKINRFKIPGGYWNIEEIKEWTYDALSAIDDKTVKVKALIKTELVDNKVKIPADVETLEAVVVEGKRLEELLPYRDLTKDNYVIDGGFIYTNFEDSTAKRQLEITYYTVPLDANGEPLIPDNRFYIAAIEAFLQYMIGKRAYFSGKILERQYIMLEQEWHLRLPTAQASQRTNLLKDPTRFAKIRNKHIL